MTSRQSIHEMENQDGRMSRRGALGTLTMGGLLVGGLLVARPAATNAEGTPAASDTLAIVGAYSTSHSSGHYDGAQLAADAVMQSPSGEIQGREAIAGFLNALYGPIGNLQVSVDTLFAEGGSAAAVYRIQGKHAGPVLGVPSTGNPIAFPLAVIYEVEDGLIARLQVFLDLLGLFQQLGGVPAAPA